jgi:hypothetical protein
MAKRVGVLTLDHAVAVDPTVVEDMMVGGTLIRLTHENVPIDKIELDQKNPRIQYRLKLEQEGKSLEQVIMAMPEVKNLRKDIHDNGGLRERVILQRVGNKFRAREGNCRTVCVQSLREKEPKNKLWRTVPARILPSDVDERQVAIMLADYHCAGKLSWKAHEKAGHVFTMEHELGMSQDEIATYLRTSKSTVNRFLQAYKMMKDRFLTLDNGKYSSHGERTWSYFDEFFRQKDLKDLFKKDDSFGDEFCRWVGDKRLPDAADVRALPSILKHPSAAKKFREAPAKTALSEAKKLVESVEPEQGSDFFKILAKFRESCTNAAQVREILKIRSDKVARQRVIDTYNALVDFMQLADVEVPEAKN